MDYDPYSILNLTKNSTPSEIRKAYLYLSKLHHPDKSKSNYEKNTYFEIKQAFEILADENQKYQIDCQNLTADAVIQDEIIINELENSEDGTGFEYQCRCGGYYYLDGIEYVNFSLKSDKISDSIFIYCDNCSGACQVFRWEVK